MDLNNCHLCNSKLFSSPLLQLKGMPKAAQYFPSKDEFAKDNGIVLNIFQCSHCGLVQLNTSPVEYFKEVITATYFSEELNKTRYNQMKKFISQFGLEGKKILEIGSGKGNTLDIIHKAGAQAVGIEAASKSVEIGKLAGRNMIVGYIGDKNKIAGYPFDAFVSFNYIEHLPDLNTIINNIYKNVTDNAAGYVVVPNFDYLLETKCFYEFVPDHLSYFTKKTLTYAFEKNGFDVLESYTINNDNDIVVVLKKKKILNISHQFNEVEDLIKNLQQIVTRYKTKNKKIAIWGAGHRTLALLALSKLNNIEYVVDSAEFKQGRYTPVLHSKIVSPKHLLQETVDLIIVMVPGLYPDEVLKIIKKMQVSADIAVLRNNKLDFVI